MKIMVHACCAPCSTAFFEGLVQGKMNNQKGKGENDESGNGEPLRTDLFWYNPNIHPYTEYQSRKDSLLAFAQEKKLELLMEDEYGLRMFLGALNNKYDETRCAVCYRIRLEKTARLALEKGYDAFSTTLLVSPYQKHDLIRQVGEECAAQSGLTFYYHDFRPWFREGQKKSREQGRYMQKYCGCIFSEEVRYTNKREK